MQFISDKRKVSLPEWQTYTITIQWSLQVYRDFLQLKNAVLEPCRRVKTSQIPKWEIKGILALQMIPSSDYPLFITNKQYLLLLDGTMKDPFFPRKADGTFLNNSHMNEFDMEGLHEYAVWSNSRSRIQRKLKHKVRRNQQNVPCSLMRELTYQVCLAKCHVRC